jgi:hypothetical protein
MQPVFSFFFRLFLAFLAARFLARFFALESLGSLIGLTLLFLGNVYLFDYLDYRSRTAWRRSHAASQPRSAPPAPPTPPKQTQET